MPKEITDFLAPGGVFAAIILFAVTLVKQRSSDRKDLSDETAKHMDRLTAERDKANRERDEANERVGDLQERLFHEREARLEAESRAVRTAARESMLQEKIADLTRQSNQQEERLQDQEEEIRKLTTELGKMRQMLVDLTDLAKIIDIAHSGGNIESLLQDPNNGS